MRQRIESNPASLWPQCSKGVQVGQAIYLSGQVGSDDDGTLAGDDIRSQCRRSRYPAAQRSNNPPLGPGHSFYSIAPPCAR